jgi:hypothetical protein
MGQLTTQRSIPWQVCQRFRRIRIFGQPDRATDKGGHLNVCFLSYRDSCSLNRLSIHLRTDD